ncbi:hypothetical protein GQ53DRAFT_662105, partial [Thozetella sp. PMI_491]
DFIIKLLLLKEPLIKVFFNNILVIINRLIKYNYFILYKKASNTKELAYIFIKNIIINYKLLDKLVNNKDKLFTLNF